MSTTINQRIGAALLLAGTAIGAGMLGMPFVSGVCGYLPTIVVMLLCFGIMLANLFLLLEATLYCKNENVNIIGMSREHLPHQWSIICWISFMLLLYSIIASYMNAGGDLISFLVNQNHYIHINKLIGILIFTIIFACVVLMGTAFIDHVNRIFMVGLLVTFFIVSWSLSSFVSINSLSTPSQLLYIPHSIPIITAAFTSHLILPSLKSYIKDIPDLRGVLFYGSLLPLILYLIWQTIVLGIVEPEGPLSITTIAQSKEPISYFFHILESKRTFQIIEIITQLFFFSAITTSFLGVLLSLNDFLADGLNMQAEKFSDRIKLILLSSLPPLFFTIVFKSAFTYAINFAALFIAILYAIIPSLVVLKCRKKNQTTEYKLPGGTPSVYIIFVFGCLFAVLSIMNVYHMLPDVI
ncbi:MAG: hypothetical protein CMF41_06355 [Legionellales bacterium]|nr:hypothetical protein [Legionellales bacterium]OUX64205.1 MAG: hypothetical protein CBE41_03900 [Gammaproteobacteria bacterium TMED281]